MRHLLMFAVGVVLLCHAAGPSPTAWAQADRILVFEDNFDSYPVYGPSGEGPWPTEDDTWQYEVKGPVYSIRESPVVSGHSVKLEAFEGRLFHTFDPITDGNLIATVYMRNSNAAFRSVTFAIADESWAKRASYITLSGNGTATFQNRVAYATTAGFQVVPDFTLNSNEWVKVTVDIDVAASTYNLYLNDDLKVPNATFHTGGANLATSLDRVFFDNSGPATGWIDELVIEWIPPASDVLPGDANRDGRVDGEDFLIWQASFGMQSDAAWDDGDFNGDGRVDGEDFLIWQAHFGSVQSGSVVTPEPSTMAAAMGLGALLMLRRQGATSAGRS